MAGSCGRRPAKAARHSARCRGRHHSSRARQGSSRPASDAAGSPGHCQHQPAGPCCGLGLVAATGASSEARCCQRGAAALLLVPVLQLQLLLPLRWVVLLLLLLLQLRARKLNAASVEAARLMSNAAAGQAETAALPTPDDTRR